MAITSSHSRVEIHSIHYTMRIEHLIHRLIRMMRNERRIIENLHAVIVEDTAISIVASFSNIILSTRHRTCKADSNSTQISLLWKDSKYLQIPMLYMHVQYIRNKIITTIHWTTSVSSKKIFISSSSTAVMQYVHVQTCINCYEKLHRRFRHCRTCLYSMGNFYQ